MTNVSAISYDRYTTVFIPGIHNIEESKFSKPTVDNTQSYDDPVAMSVPDLLASKPHTTEPITHELTGEKAIASDKSTPNTIEYAPVTTQRSTSEEPNELAKGIIRSTLLSKLLSDLKTIQKQYDTSKISCAHDLLHDMRSIRDHIPSDPILKIVMALYDSMAVDNKWADYTVDQYGEALAILKKAAEYSNIERKHVAKAINALENSGFNTLPYCVTFEDTE